MPYLLNLGYLILLAAASPWLLYQAARTSKYRDGFGAKFLGLVPQRSPTSPCIWLHAVSVGEVNLLATLITEWRKRHPDWECVISTTTKTGYELARKKYSGHAVYYCPLDFTWAVRRAVRRVRPTLLVLAELELWPNLIQIAKQEGVKVAVINGRVSEKSFRGYMRVRPLVARVLRQIDLIAAQNEQYASRFRALGAPASNVHLTGSLKFDGALTNRDNPATQRLAALAGFAPGDIVFLAGSTQDPEEQLAIEAFQQLSPNYPELRLVIVPRHPERFEAVAKLLERSGMPWQCRSEIEAHGPKPEARVLLVDSVGELGAWWGTASIAFVGGSLGTRGGQNMIEPAAYGAAVSFGPNTRNFRDIVAALLEHDAAVVVRHGAELKHFIQRCLDEPQYAAALGDNARQLVQSNVGATAKTADCLDAILGSNAEAIPRAA